MRRALPPCSVVIPAAGEGVRLPGRTRKVLRMLGGKPLLIRTLEAFSSPGLGFIKEVVLLVHPKDLEEVKRRWSQALAVLKVSSILAGGSTRAESVARGVLATSPVSKLILIHDAARPLVTHGEIRTVAETAWRRGAAILAVPASDTVKQVSPKGYIDKTLPRNRLWLAQTPQAFRRSLILPVCRHWLKGKAEKAPTDDAGWIEAHRKVWVVPGRGGNFKVTTPGDLARARVLWNLSSRTSC